MAINAYSTGVSTGTPASIDIKPDVSNGDMIYWNSTLNLFETGLPRTIPNTLSALTNDVPYASQEWVTQQILALDAPGGGVDLSNYATKTYLESQIALLGAYFDGQYSSLTGTPTTLAGYGITDAFDGTFASLTGKPNFFSGDYNDLINKPSILIQTLVFDGENLSITGGNNVDLTTLRQELSLNGTTLTLSDGNSVSLAGLGGGAGGGLALSDLSVGTPGSATGNGAISYNSATGVFTFTPPDLSGYATSASLSTVATSGSYTDLTGTPNIPTDVSQLTDTTNLLVHNAFDGDYNSLTNTPTLFDGQYSSLTGTPTLFDGQYSSLTGTPTIPADISDLTDTTSLLTHFDGDYNSLTNKPTIPSLTGYATETYVDNKIALVSSFSGDYNDLTNTPTIPTNIGSLSDVSDAAPTVGQVLKWDGSEWAPASDSTGAGGSGIALSDISVTQDSASGTGALSYNNVTGVITYTPPVLPTPFSGVYGDLTGAPTIPADVSDLTDTTNLLAGGGAASPIGWTTSGDDSQYRTTTTFTESGTEYTVRAATFDGDGKLQLELANFSPTVSATGQSLSWDETATQFSVSVNNPDDFTDRYINSVASVTGATGVHSTLSDYTAGAKSATPAGGVDWTQTFSTNVNANIVSNGTGLTGGSASATINFNDDQDAQWSQSDTISYSWQNANSTINFDSLTGSTFLQTYATVEYTLSITGLSNNSNAVTTITGSGGGLSSSSSSGTFTFGTPVHKDNGGGRTVSASTVFTRPAGVTGISYTETDIATDTTINTTFTYPSFYIFTTAVGTPPVRTDIVTGSSFTGDVTQLGNQIKNIDTFITNSAASPKAFWFAVRSSATQPTSFATGLSSALLSDVTPTTGHTVDLEPDSAPVDYVAEEYTLYGITLQPGQTYVRIS